MTVLPGLIDCHTHLADAPDEDGDPFLQLKMTAAQTAFASVPNARTFLREGFTTVRDVGVYRALNDVAMRDAIAHGFIEGPRMFVAGAYVTITRRRGRHRTKGLQPDIWSLFQVGVAIDEAGQHGHLRKIYDLGVSRDRQALADLFNPVVADENDLIVEHGAGLRIN